MDTLKITKADLDGDGYYTGTALDSVYDGHIEIAAGLGYVRFRKTIAVRGRVVALTGSGIKAGEGIEAGLSIVCRAWLTARLRVFAGLCLWRLPTDAEQTITCERFEGGTVAFGRLVETAAASQPAEADAEEVAS